MRLVLGLMAASIFAVSAAGPAQAKPDQIWSEAKERIEFNPGKVSFPRAIGPLQFTATKDFSHPGEGLDTSLRYESPDKEVFATVYVYNPSLSHSGLAALATVEAVRANSKSAVEYTGARIVDTAGLSGLAIRTDFAKYQGRHASSAAFVKADRWMIKIRVSGPDARAREVEAAMAALLDGVRFSGPVRPRPAQSIEAPPCPTTANVDAKLLTVGADASIEATTPDALMAAFDAAGIDPAGKISSAEAPRLRSRIGGSWCRSYTTAGAAKVLLLHATDPADVNADDKSMLFALYNDAGAALEIVRVEKQRYVLLHHQIGMTTVLGKFDRVPSNRQIGRMLEGKGETGAARARIRLKPSGDTDIELITDGAKQRNAEPST